MELVVAMEENEQKQQFSIAYVRAVAAVAGCNTVSFAVDEDSVDMGLRASGIPGRIRSSPQIDVQLKCTAHDIVRDDTVHFPIKRKNFDELLGQRYHIPKILIVVTVPEAIDHWIEQSEEALALRRCGYWYSLRNLKSTDNRFNVSLRIPRNQVFSPDALKKMMQDMADGKEP
jgi:hypothetical protein